jgi:two-component system, chemotaxis family, chemotaxis protein CheY
MKILIVDDSSTMRRILKTQLEGLGVTAIAEASNGEEALGALKNNMPVDIIMLDWNMPVMDGMSFLKMVRKDAAYKGVKIVMCTSESEKTRVVEAIKEGANNYIVKPFTPETVKEKLGI